MGPYGQEDFYIVKLDAAGNKQWDYAYGGADWDELTSLERTNDGGYILGGFSYSGHTGVKSDNNRGSCDFWMIKIEGNGTQLWDKTFGGNGFERAFSVHQTYDHGYIIGGVATSGINGDKTQPNIDTNNIKMDYWMVKTDSNGVKQWDKSYGGLIDDLCHDLIPTADHGYLLCGESASPISGDKTQPSHNGTEDLWLVKTDSAGIKQWDKDFGGYSSEEFDGTLGITTDGNYLVSGSSYSDFPAGEKSEHNMGQEQAWILKVDTAGNKIWDKTIFTPGHSENCVGIILDSLNYAFAVTDDGNVGGYKTQPAWQYSSGGNTMDYWLVRFTETAQVTGFSASATFKNIRLAPNPCSEQLSLTGLPASAVQITISDVTGKRLLEKTISARENIESLSTSSLENGMYLLTVSTGTEMATTKLMVQH
jgi:hypothetical protein